MTARYPIVDLRIAHVDLDTAGGGLWRAAVLTWRAGPRATRHHLLHLDTWAHMLITRREYLDRLQIEYDTCPLTAEAVRYAAGLFEAQRIHHFSRPMADAVLAALAASHGNPRRSHRIATPASAVRPANGESPPVQETPA